MVLADHGWTHDGLYRGPEASPCRTNKYRHATLNLKEVRSLDYTVDLNKEQFERIESILAEELMELGVQCVLLIDLAGNIIVNLDDGKVEHDIYSLAALAAGNFGAVSAMAKIVGEEDFSLLFHKGEKESIHFTKVVDDLLLVTIFGKEVSLGFLRLKVTEATNKMREML